MTADTPQDGEKIALFAEWMKGDHVFVHLDARRDGVSVPPHLAMNENLKLKLSYHFQGETTHDDAAISVYLKFNGKYEQCILPWSAIWGLSNSDGETCLWTENLPPELAHLSTTPPLSIQPLSAQPHSVPPLAQAQPEPKAEKKSPLSLVDKPSDRKKPALRRIK